MFVTGKLRKISIVGSGVMGIQIAVRAAWKAGNRVSLTDISEKAIAASKVREEQILSVMADKGLVTEYEKAKVRELITFTPDLDRSLKGAELVIEAIIEDLRAKRELFKKLDAVAPSDAILATNSSTIPVSRVEDVTTRREKILNIHFYDLERMPMVDLMGGTKTSKETMMTAEKWARDIDCIPIKVNKELLGFCMNRIWHSARIEALNMWANDYVDFETIDRAWMVFTGMSIGPFGMMDNIGLDTVYNVHMMYYNEANDISKKPPDKLKEMIDRGDLGVKTGKGFYSYPDPVYVKHDFVKR